MAHVVELPCLLSVFILLIHCSLNQVVDEKCSDDWLDCGNGKCVAKIWMCDNDNDCGNGKDEENCEGVNDPTRCLSSQFQCKKDGHCIPETWHCDGENDCSDESDEKDCTTTCKENEFRCLSGSCLNASLVCDGRKDCPDGSDEGNRCGVTCATMTCSQKCRTSSNGAECYCDDGYELLKDNSTCSDIDECLTGGVCSHYCENFPGGYECSCLDGFELVNRTCRAKVANKFPFFFISEDSNLFHLRSEVVGSDTLSVFPLNYTSTIGKVYYDRNANMLYISDVSAPAIRSLNMTSLTYRELVESDIKMPEDIAFDSIHGNLYWVDAIKGTVEMVSVKNLSTTVVVDSLRKPVAIAILPSGGIMFVSAIGNAKVFQYDLDGRNERIMDKISGTVVSLALHPTKTLLYWADPRADVIASIDYLDPRSDVKIHRSGMGSVVSIAVGRKYLYWTDIKHRQLYILKENSSYVHTLDLPGTGDVLAARKIAFSDVIPHSVISEAASCESKSMFSCGNGHCIAPLWRCDGETDCEDGNDELSCQETVCDDLHFRCGNGQCIPKSWVCDGASDCIDNSDENICTTRSITCGTTEFRCDDGMCIDKTLICDKRIDCQDGSDEKNCSMTDSLLPCSKFKFRCSNGDCIYDYEVCDGHKDCSNGEDERNCTAKNCNDDEYQCPSSKRCIPSRHICDGDEDCDDGADENVVNCISQGITVPPPTYPVDCEEFNCFVSGKCLPWSQVCDGHEDCDDKSDEYGFCSRSCLANNHGCTQLCRKSPSGPRCDCDNGYVLMFDGKTCEDLNECLIPGHCSHYCNNTEGGFKCSCADGYSLEQDQKKCKVDEGSATLVYQLPDKIRGIDLGTYAQRVYVNGSDIRGMDFDANNGLLFWNEYEQGTINSVSPGMSTQDILIKDLRNVDTIKWDWIAKNLYYLDNEGSIKVCRPDGNYCATLMHQYFPLVNSLSLAISPPNGLMFWSSWRVGIDENSGIIERAELDGSRRMMILTDRLKLPTGIAVDEILKLIFWVDTRLGTLEYADFHGLNRKQVLAGEMHYPFSLTIFEDFVFWADWGTDTIMRCNKFTGNECIQLQQGNCKAQEMMVSHRVKQPKGENRCENHNCPDLCLLTRTSFSCKCSDQYVERNNSCIQPSLEPITN